MITIALYVTSVDVFTAGRQSVIMNAESKSSDSGGRWLWFHYQHQLGRCFTVHGWWWIMVWDTAYCKTYCILIFAYLLIVHMPMCSKQVSEQGQSCRVPRGLIYNFLSRNPCMSSYLCDVEMISKQRLDQVVFLLMAQDIILWLCDRNYQWRVRGISWPTCLQSPLPSLFSFVTWLFLTDPHLCFHSITFIIALERKQTNRRCS